MKINLRKASIIQDILHDEVRKLDDEPHTILANLFENNICEQVEQQCQAFVEAQAKVNSYLEARRVLRTLVAQQNVKAGVHELLTEDAMLASKERRHRNIINQANPRLSDEAIKRQTQSLLNSDEPCSSVRLDVVPAELIKTFEKQAEETKRRRRKIQDKLLMINVSTEIVVPKKVVSLLQDLGLD